MKIFDIYLYTQVSSAPRMYTRDHISPHAYLQQLLKNRFKKMDT